MKHYGQKLLSLKRYQNQIIGGVLVDVGGYTQLGQGAGGCRKATLRRAK